ncbi:type IV toxin-antitoxin system AbiEi family antitoxin domain-containing protein [Limnoglobus roseus]|nr:hypothetical protein [Limnoglobus roseus]
MDHAEQILRRYQFLETFLYRLSNTLAAPLDMLPCARLITKSNFDDICESLRVILVRDGYESDMSNKTLLDWLEKVRLVYPMDAGLARFWLFEIGAGPQCIVEPCEFLTAAAPRGIICYFSAMAYHGLTVQPPAHHHIATLTAPKPAPAAARKLNSGQAAEGTEPKSKGPPKLGTVAFTLDKVHYYTTTRSSRLVPGIQERMHGPRTRIRITDREQTLLDGLYKPYHCGGEEVVFEAWKTVIGDQLLNERRLLEYLRAMEYPATTRRVGALLEHLDFKPSPPLARHLEAARNDIDRAGEFAVISLLPGVPYTRLDDRWLVKVP